MSAEMLTKDGHRVVRTPPPTALATEEAEFRAAARRQLKRVRRLKINLAAWALGSILITGLWVLNQWQATGAFEVQEYRKPEFEVIVTPASRFAIQGNEAVATVQARYYFGQPVANGHVRWVLNQQPYYSPLQWMDADEAEETDGGEYSFYGEETSEQTATLNDQGVFEATVPLDGRSPDQFVYRLRVREGTQTREVGDPYRFGSILSDYDLHLFAEGTHYRAWERFGPAT